MDIKTRGQLATHGFQKYLLKTYLKNQMTGMIRLFQARYSMYMTVEQMNHELDMIDKLLVDLDIQFIINPVPNIAAQESPAIERKVIDSKDRCHARVWDVKNLVWEYNGRKVYGSQCRNSKSPDSGTNYCRKHMKKLTHEDWFTEPSDVMRQHFTAGLQVL